jgi:hypothetical protein
MARNPLPKNIRKALRVTVSCNEADFAAYEWARKLSEIPTNAEWARELLNAEVARLRRKHGKPE